MSQQKRQRPRSKRKKKSLSKQNNIHSNQPPQLLTRSNALRQTSSTHNAPNKKIFKPKLTESDLGLFERNDMLHNLRNKQIVLRNNVKEELQDYEKFHLDTSKAILIAIQKSKLKKLQNLKEKQLQIMGKIANFNQVSAERDDLIHANRRLSDQLKKGGGIRLKADQQLSSLQQIIYKDLNACIDDSIAETQDITTKLNMILSSSVDIKQSNKHNDESKEMTRLQQQINILKLIIVEYQERQFSIKTKPFTILDSLIQKMQQLDDLEQLYKLDKTASLP